MFKARDVTDAANVDTLDKTVADFRKSDRGVQRATAARADLYEISKGAKVAKIGLLEQEADADLAKSGARDTTGNLALANLIKWGSLRTVDPQARVRDRQILRRLWSRMTPDLQKKYKADMQTPPTEPAMRANLFNRMIGDVEGTGRSAVADEPLVGAGRKGAPAAPGGRDPQMDEQTKEIKELREGFIKAFGARVPRPLVANPAMQRR